MDTELINRLERLLYRTKRFISQRVHQEISFANKGIMIEDDNITERAMDLARALEYQIEILIANSSGGAGAIYYGLLPSKVNLTPSEIEAGNKQAITSGEDYIVNFGYATTPMFAWVAQELSEPIKHTYKDTVVPTNTGVISGTDSLFGTPVQIGNYLFMITNYKTLILNPIQFLK